MDSRAAARADDLLAHSAWMGSLARQLVRDASRADDLVQETWLSALRRGPDQASSLRPWLARVLGRLAMREARATRRRASREERVARPEPLESPASVVARAELHRQVVEAVLEIPEPFRTTLLERYFEERSCAEIARRSGIPEGTARWRVARGLELLRERLDARHGGDRFAWCVALLPLTKPATAGAGIAAVFSGVVVMKAAWTLGGVAAAGVLAVLLARGLSTGAPGTPQRASVEPELAVAPGGPEEAKAPAAAGGAETRVAQAQVVFEVRPPSVRAFGRKEFTVEARAIDPSGGPIAGATLTVFAFDGRTSPASGIDGRIHLEFDSGDADGHRLGVQVRAPGRATAFLETRVARGDATQLGEIVLEPGGSVSGRVVRGDGAPIAGARVVAGPHLLARPSEEELRLGPSLESPVPESRTSTDGTFRIEGVATGSRLVWAGADGMRFATIATDVQPDADAYVGDIVLGPLTADDVITGSVLAPDGSPVPYALVWVEIHDGGYSNTRLVQPGEDGRFRVVLERKVPHTLRAEDHRKRWPASPTVGADPGSDVTLRFRAPRMLELAAHTPGGGPIDGASALAFSVATGAHLESADAKESEALSLREPAEAFRVDVEANGFERRTLGPFEPGAAPARIDVSLAPIAAIHGRVTAAGEPVKGASIVVRRFAALDEEISVNGFASLVHPHAVAESKSDEDGRFVVTPRDAGDFVVRAEADHFAPAEREARGYEPGQPREVAFDLD
ncbi:MAG TPA: sigma-70 family RNA polymerase sigma factor, partial [Planctomycetota bacterium]|nr:sigma-70 family RNA polymerase sigma factor [Planctomycetota bacterium]